MALKLLKPSWLEKLIAAGKPIYVINSSATKGGDKGTICVNFVDGQSRDFFKMPPTFIPMAISDAIPTKILLESRDFRQLLLKGMLTLVEPAGAEDFLSSPEAQEEYEALILSNHSARAQNIDLEREVSQRTKIAHQSGGHGHGPVQDVSAVDTVSNKVRGYMESLVSEELTPKQVLTELRRRQSALTAIDFSYVAANTTDKELKRFAKKSLVKATAYDEEEEDYEEVAPKKKRKKAAVAEKDEDNGAFSFEDTSTYGTMTAAERQADQEAQAAAMASQAVDGRSKIDAEINKIMTGKL